MVHKIEVTQKSYYALESGFKSIEIRPYDEKCRLIQPADTVEFSCGYKTLHKNVTALHTYDSFIQLWASEPLLKCGCTPFTLPEASPKDMERLFSAEDIKKYGAAAVVLEEIPLQRFLAGQAGTMPYCSDYATALDEIRHGHKTTHWIWYVFPQLRGRTSDTVTEYYALNGKAEAEEYLRHPVLGARLLEITTVLLSSSAYDLVAVFGTTDAFKLRACMTLFDELAPEEKVFGGVLDKYCMGIRDDATLRLL